MLPVIILVRFNADINGIPQSKSARKKLASKFRYRFVSLTQTEIIKIEMSSITAF